MSAEWVPVYIGAYADVLVLREALNANGVPCLAPDADNLGPYPAGQNVFAVQLLVPPDRLADAMRLIPPSKRAGIPSAGA